MKSQLHEISNQGLEEKNYQGKSSLDKGKSYWLEIKTDSRTEAIDYLFDFEFDNRIIANLDDPSITTRALLYGSTLLINLVVSNTNDIYQSGYLSVIIVAPNVLVTIIEEGNKTFDDFIDEARNSKLKLEINIYDILYFMVCEILQKGIENLAVSKKKVNTLARVIDEDPDEVVLSEIISVKREIGQLTNVAEDQYNMLGFVPKIMWTEDSKVLKEELMEQIHGLAHLKNSLERIEGRVDIIHSHYQLILQERSSKRLSILTVVQSIFVPLSFLTGIYGLNFLFTPQIDWHYGYYILLGLMICLPVIQLWLFKRSGWFD